MWSIYSIPLDRALDDAYRIGYVDGASDMLFMKDIYNIEKPMNLGYT